MARVVCIYGPPGSGKTTVAIPLAGSRPGAGYISSGDIARRVDPDAIARGEMADRDLLRRGFTDALLFNAHREVIIIDGLPRDPSDVELLPDDTTFILLTCRPTVSIDRQAARGRPGDERDIIIKRTTEQYALLGLAVSDGWAYRLANKIFETSDISAATMYALVNGWLRGVPVG